MEPTAHAIRLDPLETGPEDLKGKRPLVVFTGQGMAGADEKESLPAADPRQMAAGRDLEELALPPRVKEAAERRPAPKFEIEDIVIIVDRSGSMADTVSPDQRETKLEHVKDALTRLGSDCFPDSRISLIAFNERAVEVKVAAEPGGISKAVSRISAGGITSFRHAFALTEEILNRNSSGGIEGRRAVIFVTDGKDLGSRSKARELAERLRGKNAGTFLIGVGADYDLSNIIELAGKFAYSGWAHTPMEQGQNVFNLFLPSFLSDIQSSEYYLKVVAPNEVDEFYGLTPSIRRAENGVFFVGYQGEGVGICFVRDNAAPRLKLEIGAFEGDRRPLTKDIPVTDAAEAGALWEKLQIAKDSLAPLLILRAQLDGDIRVLQELQSAYPELGETIAGLIADMNRKGEQDARLRTLGTSSMMGSLTTSRIIGVEPVNPLSNVIHLRRPAGRDPSPGSPHLHSGPLGPLSGPVGDVPSLGRPDPGAYDRAVPLGHPKLVLSGIAGDREFELKDLRDGDAVTVGSGWFGFLVDFEIRGDGVSRRHFQIRKKGGEFFVKDLGSKQGTFLNARKITREMKLRRGDILWAGSVCLTFG